MRVGVIQSFLPSRSNGGVGHFTDQLCRQLAARGHGVTVFSLDPAPIGAPYEVVQPEPGARWISSRLGRLFGFGAWVATQDLSLFDVVHAMGDNHLLRSRIPVVRTLHGSALAEALAARRWRLRAAQLALYPLEILGSLRAGTAVAVSQASLRHFPWVRRVVPNGVDLDLFRPGAERSAAPSVLAVGHRLGDRKRLDLLVEVFNAEVRPRVPDAELWLVCDDDVVGPGILHRKALPAAELAALYRRAWLFCLPSAYEGFGRPYLEAMASGTPVVATPNPGSCEVLDGGSCGRIVSPDALGAVLVELLGDAEARESLRQAGLRKAQAYGWDTVTNAYERLYAEIGAGRPAAG